jgi:predicted aspartyl protease
MKINHRETSFLIDTGAVASCVSEQFAKTLKLKPKPAEQMINLMSANGSTIESLGVIDVELSIQGLTVPFTFLYYDYCRIKQF